MICILASNRVEAARAAKAQQWNDNEWFFGSHENLLGYDKFHIYYDSTFFTLPFAYWSKLESIVKSRQRYR